MDGASIHNGVTVYLRGIFGARWMGRYGPIRWPARSPDLNPLDFFYWPHLKNMLYKLPRMQSIPELQERITEISNEITPDMIRHAMLGFEDRLAYCQEANGGHFEKLLKSGKNRCQEKRNTMERQVEARPEIILEFEINVEAFSEDEVIERENIWKKSH